MIEERCAALLIGIKAKSKSTLAARYGGISKERMICSHAPRKSESCYIGLGMSRKKTADQIMSISDPRRAFVCGGEQDARCLDPACGENENFCGDFAFPSVTPSYNSGVNAAAVVPLVKCKDGGIDQYPQMRAQSSRGVLQISSGIEGLRRPPKLLGFHVLHS